MITCGLILFVFRLLLMVGGGTGCALLFVLLLLSLLLTEAIDMRGDPPTSAIVNENQ